MRTSFRLLILALLPLLLLGWTACVPRSGQLPPPKVFSFAVIADAQYADAPDRGARKYRLSPQKLQACVNHLNRLELEYSVHLGDFVDRDFASFGVVGPIYRQLGAPGYHVLGNHDLWVADEQKAAVPSELGMPARYYDFALHGWRFVVLDGNDLSFHAYPEGSPRYLASMRYYEQRGLSAPRWNGALGAEQLAWLERVLRDAERAGERVVVFSHYPVYPEDEVHNLWNDDDVIGLLESFDVVAAYFAGHNHAGNYGIRQGIHYLTFKAMLDTEETSYAVVRAHEDRLAVTGFGREEDRVLLLR